MSDGSVPSPHNLLDLRIRVASALVLGPLALLAAALGPVTLALILTLVGGVAGQEWVRLTARDRPGRREILGMETMSIAGIVLAAWMAALVSLGIALLGLLVFWAAAYVRARRWGVRPAGQVAAGILYIGLAVALAIWLRDRAELGLMLALWLIIGVSITDIGAFLGGRLMGGPKLAPSISPGKTWSGAATGFLAAGLAGAGIAWLNGWSGPGQCAVIGAVMSCVAQLGDLLESALKRRAGRKDSGSIMPGHGGMLDRIDGFLAATPAFAVLLLLSDLPVRLN